MTENLSQGEDIRLSKILIFAGTTEGRKLSEHLCERGIEHTVCVATEYGEIVLHENPFAHVHMGRMDSEGMRSFFAEQKCKLIVDATHPYAAIVTENIKQAVYAFNEAHAVTDRRIAAYQKISNMCVLKEIRIYQQIMIISAILRTMKHVQRHLTIQTEIYCSQQEARSCQCIVKSQTSGKDCMCACFRGLRA